MNVDQFGADAVDATICSLMIQFYLLPSFPYHDVTIAALCGCCREGVFFLIDSL